MKKYWKIWVIGAITMSLLGTFIGHYLVANTDGFKTASEFLRSHPEVIKATGSINDLSLSWMGGAMSMSGDNGKAHMTINITGTTSSPQAYVELVKRGVWEVKFARLLPKNENSILLKE
jgi:Cytochrome oxidase complex assembly protein 1